MPILADALMTEKEAAERTQLVPVCHFSIRPRSPGDAPMPICAFCGKQVDNLTNDHIPPRAIFGANPDYNLITVPSCGSCNWGTSKDDEYFKLLAVEEEASETPVAWHVNESTIRAMNRRNRPKYGRMVRSMMEFGDVYSQGGVYLGKHSTLALDYTRILKSVEKTIRGLFYHHMKRPLPEGYDVWCHLIPRVRHHLPEEVKAGLEEIIDEVSKAKIVTIGPSVFRYRCGFQKDNRNLIYIILGFYGRHDFVGFTHRKQGEEAAADLGG